MLANASSNNNKPGNNKKHSLVIQVESPKEQISNMGTTGTLNFGNTADIVIDESKETSDNEETTNSLPFEITSPVELMRKGITCCYFVKSNHFLFFCFFVTHNHDKQKTQNTHTKKKKHPKASLGRDCEFVYEGRDPVEFFRIPFTRRKVELGFRVSLAPLDSLPSPAKNKNKNTNNKGLNTFCDPITG